MLYPEFYNDVFGPIMQPGSSSHMAAPCRAGYMCNSLLGGDPLAEIRVELDSEGSFKGTFGQMHEDLGMLNGAMGRLPDDSRFFTAEQELKGSGIPYVFDFCEMKESPHINSLKFILTGKSGKKVSLVANSTGGGMIETVRVNGYEFAGKGDSFVLCVFDKDASLDRSSLAEKVAGCQDYYECGTGEGRKAPGIMHWFRLWEAPGKALLKELENLDFAVLKPVLPVCASKGQRPQLFTTMTEWRRLAEEQRKTLDEVAIDYEIAASGWSREQVVSYMRDRVKPAMHRRTHAVYEEGLEPVTNPFTELHYKYWQNAQGKLPLDLGVLNKSIKYVMAGQPEFPGVLNVPGPMGTGGGFCYGVLSAVAEDQGLSDDVLLSGLFIAAGVGAIAYTRTSPTGEVTGCTGECGVCTAMAAAGVTHMLGGTPEMVENAASCALQASIGWPCDPIPGGGDQPCMNRVLFIASMGVVYSQWALAGVPALLPFHETVDVADRMGKQMSGDLLCTARGGHCWAPTAQKCAHEFRAWRDSK